MESLALLAILVAIICVGYVLLNIAFRLLSTIVAFIEANKLAFAFILALGILAFWLGHHQGQ